MCWFAVSCSMMSGKLWVREETLEPNKHEFEHDVKLPSAGAGGLDQATSAFSTEAEASATIPSNPQLDRDGDGRACETLP